MTTTKYALIACFIVAVIIILIYIFEVDKPQIHENNQSLIQVRLKYKVAGNDTVIPIVLSVYKAEDPITLVQSDFNGSNVKIVSATVYENGKDCTDSYAISIAKQRVVITQGCKKA